MSLAFSLKGATKAIAKLEPTALIASPLRQYMVRSATVVQRAAIANAPTGATRRLRQSIHAEVDSAPMPKFAVIVAAEHYARFVHYGTRPHWPPWGPGTPLERWTKKKLGPDVSSFLVARKIAERGTPAQPFLQRAIDQTTPERERFLADAKRQIMANFGF